MYIVCWMTHDHKSDWMASDSLEVAQAIYNKLIELDSTYSATIAGVIESTDYDSINSQEQVA